MEKQASSVDHRFCGPRLFWHFNGNIEKLGISDDVPESEGSYWFSGRNVRKSRPFECNGLHDFKGGWSPKKRGVPKNAGISDDMYENKGQKNSYRGYPTMFMKTSNLTVLSDDIDENKPLNARSALAQRAMPSGFIGNSLFAATRVYLAKRRGLKLPLRGATMADWLAERGAGTHPYRPPISQSFTLR
jgi:hypothetical protein